MSPLAIDNQKIGCYLTSVIRQKYPSVRQFCAAYLELRDGQAPDDEEIRKLLNRFSQILRGERRIQIEDLPYLTELLNLSYEAILSAGQVHIPVASHMTNYDLAASSDEAVWERYLRREDKLFLNCDEYGKSVLDYAFDFKNYPFLKYLLEKGFIWFVDNTDSALRPFTYGAGTSIKRREISQIDTGLTHELREGALRNRMIALAVQQGDCDVLDSLRARELPGLDFPYLPGYSPVDITAHRNEELIQAIALADDKIADYFSQEFTVAHKEGENTFLFFFLGAVIDAMLENKNWGSAELVIRRAIRHNKNALTALKKLIAESYTNYTKPGYFYDDGFTDRAVWETFYCDQKNELVSYYYIPATHKSFGMFTNIVRADRKAEPPLLRELLKELNGTYREICSLKEGKA